MNVKTKLEELEKELLNLEARKINLRTEIYKLRLQKSGTENMKIFKKG